mmetsp:Transcript_45467/g.90005  ORF Transcript_45467/g.90005 Transcript_45467/m.90005 type:complete len:292 (+) Transcript_45467:130-1005(+)
MMLNSELMRVTVAFVRLRAASVAKAEPPFHHHQHLQGACEQMLLSCQPMVQALATLVLEMQPQSSDSLLQVLVLWHRDVQSPIRVLQNAERLHQQATRSDYPISSTIPRRAVPRCTSHRWHSVRFRVDQALCQADSGGLIPKQGCHPLKSKPRCSGVHISESGSLEDLAPACAAKRVVCMSLPRGHTALLCPKTGLCRRPAMHMQSARRPRATRHSAARVTCATLSQSGLHGQGQPDHPNWSHIQKRLRPLSQKCRYRTQKSQLHPDHAPALERAKRVSPLWAHPCSASQE